MWKVSFPKVAQLSPLLLPSSETLEPTGRSVEMNGPSLPAGVCTEPVLV